MHVTLSDFTFLYVEDDKETQERMKMILEEDMGAFYQAFNGKEGLQMYHRFKPDIIIADINMPLMDGLTMAKEIRAKDNDTPIILLSAFDNKELLKQAIDIGVDSFLSKPIDIDELYQKLEEISTELARNLSEKRAEAEKIENLYKLAHFDMLTKAPNRFLFDLKLDQAISRAKRNDSEIALFIIDLDNFKQINDRHGHLAGDKVLETVSGNIQSILRTEDTLARLGGDEFSLIVEDNPTRSHLEKVAQKIIDIINKPVRYDSMDLRVQCSIGIARWPQDSHEKNDLIHSADIAMYKAKHLGKGMYIFYEDLL